MLAGTVLFTVMDTVCAYKRHCGAASTHRWIFEQTSFKLGSCGGFRRPEARGVLPCSPDLSSSRADHVCRVGAYFWFTWTPFTDSWGLRAGVTQTTWALQDFSTLPTKREWVAYQRFKWDAMIAARGPVIFEHDSAAEIQEVFQFTRRLGRPLFHVDDRIKLAFRKSEVLCCWKKRLKAEE